jgi:hypothetical protein
MAYGVINSDLMTTSDGVSSAGLYGLKNRLINGDMRIDQRNAGASVTPTNGAYTLDRFYAGLTQTSKFTVQRNAASVTPPVGFTNYLGVTSSSAYSVLTGDTFYIAQPIEGLNIADFAWGTANAATVTLSFWVRSSLTGTFGGSLNNSSGTRSYPFTYTISSANTWEKETITIVGDTTGTWLTTNGIGTQVTFSLGTGATFSGTAGAWAGANYASATGATSVVGTNGATFYITGVQLEKGSTATSFDYRPYGTELALCQRYCPAWTATGLNAAFPFIGQAYGTTSAVFLAAYPVQPRVAATGITTTGTFSATTSTYGYTAAGTLAIFSTGVGTGTASLSCTLTGISGIVAGNSTNLVVSSGAGSTIIATGCEL